MRLCVHHHYENNWPSEWEPVGVGELAHRAAVSKSTASGFIVKWFSSHEAYKVACVRKAGRVAEVLRQLDGEPPLQ